MRFHCGWIAPIIAANWRRANPMKKVPQVSVGLRMPLWLVNAPSRNRAAGRMHKRLMLQVPRRQTAS
jgi:hypothetical protein